MNKEKYAKQDEQLYYHIERLQQGNVESYTGIYNLSSKYLYKLIYDIVQDYHTTEDMLQETFIKIYNSIGTLQSPQAYYVWAGRIATNLCVRYIHKYRKEILQTPTDDGEGNEEFIFDTVADDNEMFIPESVLDNKEHQRIIGDVIDKLSPEQKLAVQCFYFEEMSVKEIAILMECSEGTIKSRLNYARKSIKEAVLNIEKTQGTKLYSFGMVPVLLLAYRYVAGVKVASSAVAGTGAALAGNLSSAGSISAVAAGATGAVTATTGGAVTVGATASTGAVISTTGGTVVAAGTVATSTGGVAGTTGATTASAGAAVAGISGKVIAVIIAAITSVIGVTVGIVVGALDGCGRDKEYVDEYQTTFEWTEDATEPSSKDMVGKEEEHGDIIPPGGIYIVAATGEELKEGDEMPNQAGHEDLYFYGQYKYVYYKDHWRVHLNVEDYATRTTFENMLGTIAGEAVTEAVDLYRECVSMTTAPVIPTGVEYIGGAFAGCKSLVEAPELPDTIIDMSYTFSKCTSLLKAPEIPAGVTNMYGTFSYCENLTEAPDIPDGVVDMTSAFSDCTNLIEAPDIPDSVKKLAFTFLLCKNLTKAPDIPDGVTDMSSTFALCTSLTGRIIINANPLEYEGCFSGIDFIEQGIKLRGSSSLLKELEDTAS